MDKYTASQYVNKIKEHNLLVHGALSPEIGDKTIEKISYSSKDVIPNTLFVCKGRGFKEEYLDAVVENGAVAYISEIDYRKSIPCILVKDVQKTLSLVSNIYFNYPWHNLNLIGITGTKGKSTTSYYVKYILDEYLKGHGKPDAGIISSINTFDGIINEESHLTTPESLDLQGHFHNAKSSNLEYMVTEVSSQALKYGRLYDVDFNIGVFLNISEDHLSPVEHSDFEDYFSSKLKLFKKCNIACINLQTDCINEVLEASRDSKEIITFGTSEEADIFGYNVRKDGNNTIFNVRTDKFDQEFMITMPGLFNVENALAAISVAYALDIPSQYIYEGLKKAKSSGRMEVYSSKNNEVIVIVDYAHNKLSFTKLYESTKEEYKGRKITTVFGCPGGKAYTRRKDLGLLSGIYSDRIILTSEDPAYENAVEICEEIATNIKPNNRNYEIVEDREEAIRKSILTAEPNSIILLTGKGDETRQKFGNQYVPYPSDVECTLKYLKEYDEAVKEAAIAGINE